MMFNYDNKNYSFSDTLDPVKVHDELLTKAITEYKRTSPRLYVEAGFKNIKLPPEFSGMLTLTCSGLDTFLHALLSLFEKGWELNPAFNSTANKYIYSTTLVRKQNHMKKDVDNISKTIPEKVKSYMEGFELAKQAAKANYEKGIREELAKIQESENKKAILLKQLKEVA